MPVKLGGNPLRLHCMPAWHGFAPIRPPKSTRQAYNAISMDLHPIQPGRHTMLSQWISTQFDQAGIQCYLNGFPFNSTTLFDQADIQCNLNGFAPNRPGRHTMLSQWISTQFDHPI